MRGSKPVLCVDTVAKYEQLVAGADSLTAIRVHRDSKCGPVGSEHRQADSQQQWRGLR